MKFIRKHKKLFIILIIIAVVVGGTAVAVRLALGNMAQMAEGEDGVMVQALEKQDLSTTISSDGKVESQHVVSVSTELTGKCKELNVALGDHVEEGQVLCTFDTEEIESQISELEQQASAVAAQEAQQKSIAQRQLDDAKASQTESLNAQSAKIASAQMSLDAARAQLEAMQADENTDPKDLEAMSTEVQSLEAQVAEENAEYAALQASTQEAVQSAQDNVDTTNLSSSSDTSTSQELSKLYRQRDEATVVAEQSGTITSLNISQGGIPNGSLMTISDADHLQVSVSIREKDILKLREGLHAKITSDALGDDADIRGTVTRVINFTSGGSMASESPEGGSEGGSSSGYSADILVDDGSGLLLGMSVKVEIMVSETGESLAVPYDSIVNDEDGAYVLVARLVEDSDTDYRLSRVEVTTGESNDYYTAITAEELAEGDLIVLYPEGYADGDITTITDTVQDIDDSFTIEVE